MLMCTNTNILYKLLVGFRTGISSLIINTFKYTYLRSGLLNTFHIQLEINIKYLFPFMFFCKKHSLCLFDLLIDLICFEFISNRYRFILIYSLLNLTLSTRLFVKFKVCEWNSYLLSLTSLFYSSGWMEREVFDFFGLYFFYNKDLRRILLDYGFLGFPLRKDFPLSGFIELYYDDTIKKISYEKIALNQEYRIFFTQKNSFNYL